MKYRQGADGQRKAVEEFLRRVLGVQERSRESLETQAPLVMSSYDWSNFKNAKNCYICNESLVRPEFLDSVGARDRDMGIAGKATKRCFHKQVHKRYIKKTKK